MIVGYARTSTASQVAGLEGQIRDLEVAGCEHIFSEQTSAVGPRSILDQALVPPPSDFDRLNITQLQLG
jgi:DNA invertase Pin-like site-specific DNA recombinase